MKKKYFWSLLTIMMVAMLSVGFASCGGENDDDMTKTPNLNENTNSNEDVNDYTATTTVKTVTLKNGYQNASTTLLVNDIIIYADFNYKYSLLMKSGKLHLSVYQRENGSWHGYIDGKGLGYVYNGQSQNLTKTMTVGKVDNINSIKEKVSEGYSYPSGEPQTIQPNYGYAMAYTTEDKITKYLRVYINEYSLDSNGALNTITIQYQLY